MLLPSDVARLVLGYLQQEKLPSTCRAFIAESPNLKEYAEQHTDDGAIPGCLLSLFGKSLTTILNEYITMKAKENDAEIPYMMSSLWKKLDHTLSQIRCMQDSAAFQVHQRVRTRKGIDDRMRQKLLCTSVPASPVLHPVIHQTSTPVLATQYILQPINTPVASQSVSSMLFNGQPTMQSNSPLSSIVSSTQTVSVASTQRKQTTTTTTATSSPMRRKQDNRRRRIPAASSSSTAAERDAGLDADAMQGLIDDGFPQLVIENAREKILSNKSLQEKLAENINKILASDSAAQTSKQGDGVSVEQDTSIDEILGLQGGEIHMSEEAINDILVQTELDPDFQELYDLFACVSTKTPKIPSRDPPPQSTEAKSSGSEKSKKQDNMEEGSSKEQIGNKIDECPKEKEASSKLIEPSSSEISSSKTDGIINSQEMCVNEATITSGMQRPKSDKVSPDLIISIDSPESENLVDDGKESHATVLEISSSQPMDVEMEIISSADDGADDCCFIVEDVLPDVPLSKNSGKSVNVCPEGSEHEEPTVVIIGEETTNEKVMETSQQERTDNLVTIQSPPPAPQSDVMVVPCTSPFENSSSEQNKDSQNMESSKASPFSKPHEDDSDATNKQNDTEPETSEKDTVSQASSAVNVDLAAHESVVFSTGITAPDGTQASDDASSIVTLNIITEDLPEDSELSSAVKSLSEDNCTTIILSPLVKSQDLRLGPAQGGSSGDVVESSVTGESQFLATSSNALMNSVNVQNGDCTVYAVSGTSAADGSVIQLMPTSGSTFAPSGNLFISAANGAPAKPPNIMMLSNSSAVSNGQKPSSLFQTPPRPGSVYTVGQTISPKLSQGSTIILASPVQPMLQGVMGMFPVSLVGQSSGTFSAQPHQILHVPISKPLVPKLPLPPKSQKPPSKLAATTGKSLSNLAADSTNRSTASMPRESDGKNPTSETQKKPDDRSLPETANLASKSGEAHRRVLCFDGTSRTSVSPSSSKGQKNKNDPIKIMEAPSEAGSTEINVSKDTGKTESSTSSLEKNSKGDIIAPTKDQPGEKRSTSSSGGSPGNKENVLRKGAERHGTGQTDKKITSQENVRVEKTVKQPQETVKRQTPLPNILRRTPQKISSERVCSTSPLAKQASQLLQDMHFQSPTSKPRSVGDLPLPRTPGSGMEEKVMDNHSDHLRTPVSRLYNEDGGMLKPMMPPTTPDLPTCSPASEAGSENSVNMAAHTLMILSQASISKSSSHTPLKDNSQQSRSSKSSAKKRRLEETKDYEKRPHKKELLSPSSSQRKKKMKKQRKKSSDNFPSGMDVEKFLMSLHYDE
ncbi:protein NPAT [Hyperolius riggenbachi]|uniref:protein NPAT n=1 Tax=Hyperolius riggenbachi TaxID=752182 RepID=UPI0035A30A93